MISQGVSATKQDRHKRWFLLAVLALFSAILVTSILPLQTKRALGFDRTHTAHTLSHLLVFATLAALLRAALRRRPAAEAALLAIAAGGALEILEALVYHNPVEWRDVRLDSTAACVGALVVDWVVRRASGRSMP